MTAKQDERASIRTVQLEDAPALLALLREIVEEGEYFIAVSEEFNKTLEQQEDSIRHVLENEGRKVKEFKRSDDDYIDDILMYKFV